MNRILRILAKERVINLKYYMRKKQKYELCYKIGRYFWIITLISGLIWTLTFNKYFLTFSSIMLIIIGFYRIILFLIFKKGDVGKVGPGKGIIAFLFSLFEGLFWICMGIMGLIVFLNIK